MNALADHFRRTFSRAPEGVWAAPGRVNLIGEHTDYNDGFVLPFALQYTVRVAAARRDDRLVVMSSRQSETTVTVGLDDLAPGSIDGWGAYAAGVIWVLHASGRELSGFDLLVDGDVPLGAGLSSSAALECAVALAVTDLCDIRVSREELVGTAQRAENDFVGMPCGIMDQSAALLAREGHALLLDTRTLEGVQVPFDISRSGLALVVIDTRAPHRLVDGEYAARRQQCEQAAALLGVRTLRDLSPSTLGPRCARLEEQTLVKRVRHVVTENQRVLETAELLRGGHVADIGPLLTASHASLRDDYEVTVPELDVTVETVLAEGALGARMVGGGFGGCVICLTATARVDTTLAAVKREFTAHGFAEPAAFTAVPSAGARRVS